MDLKYGNKNVICGIVAILMALPLTYFIERAGAKHQFHDKAAQALIDAKNTPQFDDDQVTDIKKGPAYRMGGLYFNNVYPDSYVRVFNFYREAGQNLRLFLWMFGLINILIGVVVGLKSGAGKSIRKTTSVFALVGFLFVLRDLVFFSGKYLTPEFTPMSSAPILYPLMIAGSAAIFVAGVLSLVIFVRGIRNS